jgi:hypothetical protein
LVVLLVMIALLGLGMTGLFLTGATVQMGGNINMRNQALVVAEAGVERARWILNNATVPSIPGLLAGSTPSADEIPNSPDGCSGQLRGAVLVDKIACSGSGCPLLNVHYPAINRATDLPGGGAIPPESMGSYTVYIRQDLADCRMGNFTCDNAPAAAIDGGAAAPCTPPEGAPTPNGVVVVRSEGVALDGRTRVALEVTMVPAQTLVAPTNAPISALCAAGANGCDDSSSVQVGIIVNSNVPQTPPVAGSSGSGGAGGAAGAGGAGGAGGSGAPPGGGGTAGGAGGAAGSGTGGSATGGASGAGGTGGACQPSACPAIATMGVYGLQKATNFAKWLADHSSNCMTQDLNIETTAITDALLAPYKVILVLDVGHTRQNYADYWNQLSTDWWGAWNNFSKPAVPIRQFSAAEGQAVMRWVQNGGGLMVTNGYDDSLWTNGNFNTILEPLGLVYYSPPCGLDPNCGVSDWYHSNYGVFNVTSFVSHPISSGMTNFYLNGYWPISGYPLTSGIPTALGGNYMAWALESGKNVGVAGIFGSGRVVVIADEWLTFDYTMASAQYGPSALAYWNNSVAWLGNCSGFTPVCAPATSTIDDFTKSDCSYGGWANGEMNVVSWKWANGSSSLSYACGSGWAFSGSLSAGWSNMAGFGFTPLGVAYNSSTGKNENCTMFDLSKYSGLSLTLSSASGNISSIGVGIGFLDGSQGQVQISVPRSATVVNVSWAQLGITDLTKLKQVNKIFGYFINGSNAVSIDLVISRWGLY